MDLKFSKVTRKGPVTIITLSRPEVYNALHIDAHFELNKVFDDFSADPAQWVAIVTGAGDKAFCAGNDLKWQAAGGKRGWDKGGFAGLTSRFDCDKPIIAAVNGVAMGGGFPAAFGGGPTGFNDVHPAWSPDGARIAFARGGDQDDGLPFHIHTVTLATGKTAQVTSGRVVHLLPSWQPL